MSSRHQPDAPGLKLLDPSQASAVLFRQTGEARAVSFAPSDRTDRRQLLPCPPLVTDAHSKTTAQMWLGGFTAYLSSEPLLLHQLATPILRTRSRSTVSIHNQPEGVVVDLGLALPYGSSGELEFDVSLDFDAHRMSGRCSAVMEGVGQCVERRDLLDGEHPIHWFGDRGRLPRQPIISRGIDWLSWN